METQALKQFVTLAETLHFGRASNLSNISASALSRSIQRLEARVGAPLFERDNRTVALTHAGEKFLDYARNALGSWDEICNTLLAEAGELHGEVSMYCSVTASYSFLFELLDEFRREHPHVEIKLHTGDPEDAIERVSSGTEDIAIGARPDYLPADLAFRLIRVSPLVFVAASKNVELVNQLKGKSTSKLWADVPMIVSESGLARHRVDAWFGAQNIQPKIYAQVAGNEAIVSMVSLGFGVGVVPEIVLQNSPLADKVQILAVKPTLQSYEVGLFTLRKKLRNPLISAFWSQGHAGVQVESQAGSA
jgi:LysR family positive regulator for ilvC